MTNKKELPSSHAQVRDRPRARKRWTIPSFLGVERTQRRYRGEQIQKALSLVKAKPDQELRDWLEDLFEQYGRDVVVEVISKEYLH